MIRLLFQIKVTGMRVSERLRDKFHDISPEPPLNLSGGYHVFDGGDEGNPPLVRPSHISEGDWTSHSVRGELKVISCPPGKGVRCKVGGSNNFVYTLVPRREALGLFKDGFTPEVLIKACREAIQAKKTSTKRSCCGIFSERPYAGDIGATALRIGGVSELSSSAQGMNSALYDVLFSYSLGLEDVTKNASEYEDIRRIEEAKNSVGFVTMRSSDGEVYAKWTTAQAVGVNLHASSHKDRDFFESVVTAHKEGAGYNDNDDVVVYFCFPELGHAVPLKPGMILVHP